ncbi:MAG TPA: M50 family metallopeptidase [Hyphomonadaceae bacterium]|nr:M50 family metallopeptidase [Hyphomonadaceae bacterium]
MMDVISFIGSFIPFIVVISIVITVHELGHYWVGRMFNAAAESFAVGFGRPIVEIRDKRGTRWRINWLPLGGFVKFVGEIQAPTDTRAAADQNKQDGDLVEAVVSAGGAPVMTREHAKAEPAHEVHLVGKAYPELGPLKRMAISLGGPFANFVFAIVVFAGIGLVFGISEAKEVAINSVVPGSIGEGAGFKSGDVIIEAGGRKVESSTDVLRATQLSAGESVRFNVLRNGESIILTATPREEESYNKVLKVKEKVGKVGLELAERDSGIRRLNPVEAVGYGFSATGDALGATLNVMRRLVTGMDGLDKLSGPIGIATLTDNITDLHLKQEGVPLLERWTGLAATLIQLVALLSIGVGFFNLLPIPVLDGGAVVMCAVEAISGREVPEKVQRVGLTIGLACLGLFALVISWQDIAKQWPGVP